MGNAQEPAAATGKRATLGRILAAAKAEFAANGVAGARVDAIAAAAGVTKQLVYYYYEGKDKLFEAVLAEVSGTVMPELLALDVAHLPPKAAMRALLNHIFGQYEADLALRSLVMEGARYRESHTLDNKFGDMAPGLVTLLGCILERGAASGDFRSGLDARVITALAALVTTGGFTNRFMLSVLAGFDTTSPEGVEAWRRHSADFVLAAISAQGSATK